MLKQHKPIMRYEVFGLKYIKLNTKLNSIIIMGLHFFIYNLHL